MINLLPPYYQKELKERKNQKLILIIFFLFSFFLIYLILILLLVKFYIEAKLNLAKSLTIFEEKKFQTEEIKDFKKKTELLNQNIAKLNKFYKKKINLSDVLENIFKNIPKEIILNGFSWQKGNSTVNLFGIAKTREALLELQKNLESSKEFLDLKIPIDVWTKKENINFSISFKISQ